MGCRDGGWVGGKMLAEAVLEAVQENIEIPLDHFCGNIVVIISSR